MFFKNKEESYNEIKIVNNIRNLSLDMIDNANSGHPGIALGAAGIIYTLYSRHMTINPEDYNWVNRDRFILSCGHASSMLYATLFMAGYDISIDDLKGFRQLDSITPGHPEYMVTKGVDMSTGPLGQGFASSVGIAIGESYLKEYFNSKKSNLIDYYTYVMCSDGDLMEGVSYEAASLAGTLCLNKLIVLYDSNNICLDGNLNKTFNDDIEKRFSAVNWNVFKVNDGDDIDEIDNAIKKAKDSKDKPSIIIVNTVIGKYSVNQGTNKVHGAPLSKEDLKNVKEKLGVRDIPFTVSDDAISFFRNKIKENNSKKYDDWKTEFNSADEVVKEELLKIMNNDFTIKVEDLDITIPENRLDATRNSSYRVINSIFSKNSFIIGGSADLFSSCKNYIESTGDYSKDNRLGKNIWFGVREHAMGAILNGLVLAGLRSFGSTFLSFSDYLKPSIRLAAIMNLPVIYIFTHDSISVGEDGPTHQPIEQLAMLRSIPNLEVFRPADFNEVLGTYKYTLAKKSGPTAIILGRNEVFIQETTKINDVSKGAYIIKEEVNNLSGIIISTGEELSMAMEVSKKLEERGFGIRVISMPSISKFEEQDDEYKGELLPIGIKTFVIEASSSYSWYKYVYNDKYLFTINSFGASGKKDLVLDKYGFNIEKIFNHIEELIK
ncbi:MAG: transketolase [Bacilli bacterium]|nr:transketolase [Bacilli bacterium]